ncbi:helix-turn-helix domain-containing protein [Varunaivibrio sulfuroxidans]|uniref:Death domain-containing protein n=1 Tax=Varunaivibrio sulfuroxidans TaxID=1773489 RepID=A0A4R3JAE6_9PROT|nr:helix-turn-helix transcriptional regulator [Varunaivibrio sulfuroxidans]TCS61600.1 death domain-containing protein [Varunaivibrio sulfuroxidans]WES29525.1 helix-turn-helix transcriptional regulator [Varunaivibrio sulfuroxidans]
MKRAKSIHIEQYAKFIEELCAERKRLGLSQDEVAQALGRTQSEVSKIETCEQRLDVWEFKQLLDFYRIRENAKLNQLVKEFFGLNDK